jgi:hypothetical protein
MARVTRSGGVVASCVWDYAGEMTLLRKFWDAVHEVDPSGGRRVDEGIVMPWCASGELEALWQATGLLNVRSAPLVVSASYTGFDDLWAPFPRASHRPAPIANRSTRPAATRCATPTDAVLALVTHRSH